MMTPMLDRRFRPPHPIELGAVFARFRRGRLDPTIRFRDGGVWRTTRTPDGPASAFYRCRQGEVEVTAWGEGAEWALEQAPALCGALDDDESFRPGHPVVRDLHRRRPGLRLGATGAVVEAMVPTVIEQKVIASQAKRSYAQLVRALGEAAPGPVPVGMCLAPAPSRLAATPSYRFRPWNIEDKRASTVVRVARAAQRLEQYVDLPRRQAYRAMTTIPGVGAWTAAEVGVVAFGDPDAVSVGDYHLPHTISWALAGEPRGDDQRMLELLEPFRGHRGRVIRLIEAAGIRAPRYGPRLPLVDISAL